MRRATFITLALAAAAAVSLWAAPGGSPIADAAMNGNDQEVRSLIASHQDVNSAQGDGMTALHWAARRGDLDLTRALVAAGARIDPVTRLGGYTPVLFASRIGHAPIIDALLAAGANASTPATSGVTPLMFAAASGQADAVTTLISHGAFVNAAEPARGETALMFAAANHRSDAVAALIAAKADVNIASKVTSLKSAGPTPEEAAYLAAQAAGRSGPAPAAVSGADPGRGTGRASGANAGGGGPRGGGRGRGGAAAGIAGVTRQFTYAELIDAQGGLTALHFAVRQGDRVSVEALMAAGAEINVPSGGDHTTPLLMALVNGQFDIAARLLDRGADPCIASENGVTPLYATLNVQWAPRALYPQPQAYRQQHITYLDMLQKLIDKGADVNARLRKKVWYSEYNFPLSGIDEIGATPFWRAAYASDVEAMTLLVAAGADPGIPTMKPAGRPRTGDAGGRETIDDVSGLPPVPVGGPGITPLQAAAGAGFGEGYAGNSYRNAPTGFLPAVRYLVEVAHADVNARDHEGNTALHDAAARGDNAMIEYLVSKGADVKAVNRAGETTVDMANSPVQRTEPFPETIALLEKLGAKNNQHCKACG